MGTDFGESICNHILRVYVAGLIWFVFYNQRLACDLVLCGEMNSRLYWGGVVEIHVSSELSDEHDVFGAATESKVFCL